MVTEKNGECKKKAEAMCFGFFISHVKLLASGNGFGS